MRTLVEVCVNKELKNELEEDSAQFEKLKAIRFVKGMLEVEITKARDIVMEMIKKKGESYICEIEHQKEQSELEEEIQIGNNAFLAIRKVASRPFQQLHELLENSIGDKFHSPYIGEVKYKGVCNFFQNGDRIYIESDDCPTNSFYRKKLIFESKKFKELEYPQLLIANIDGSSIETNKLMVFPNENKKDWLSFTKPWVPKKGERIWAKNSGGLWIGCYFHSMKSDNEIYVCEPRKSRDERDFVEKLTFSECVPFEPMPW